MAHHESQCDCHFWSYSSVHNFHGEKTQDARAETASSLIQNAPDTFCFHSHILWNFGTVSSLLLSPQWSDQCANSDITRYCNSPICIRSQPLVARHTVTPLTAWTDDSIISASIIIHHSSNTTAAAACNTLGPTRDHSHRNRGGGGHRFHVYAIFTHIFGRTFYSNKITYVTPHRATYGHILMVANAIA